MVAIRPAFWAWLCRVWAYWRSAIVVKPETVMAWQRKGLCLSWEMEDPAWPAGVSVVPKDVRDRIRLLNRPNPPGAPPRIRSELLNSE